MGKRTGKLGEGTEKKIPPRRNAKSPKNSWTSPRDIERRKRVAAALEYRLQSYTYEEIAKQLAQDFGIPVSPATAHGWVVEAMKEQIAEPAQQVLQFELQKLAKMESAIFADASSGDQNAINTVLRLLERRSKYQGLDKPTKVANTDEQGNYVAPAAIAPPPIYMIFGGKPPVPPEPPPDVKTSPVPKDVANE